MRLTAIFRQINKRMVGISFLTVFFWGLLAHAYGFLHSSFIHDALNTLHVEENEKSWKFAIGRFGANIYRDTVRGEWVIPWLIGILSLTFIAFSVWMVSERFAMNRMIDVLFLSGIMVVNGTITQLTANYIHDMDIDMLALLFACAAFYLGVEKKKNWLIGSFCICISLGLYQAYLSTTVSLYVIFFVYCLQKGETAKKCVQSILKACGQIICGGILYAICLFGVGQITHMDMFQTNSYNSLNKIFFWKRWMTSSLNWKGQLAELYLTIKRASKSWFLLFQKNQTFYTWILLLFILLVILLCWKLIYRLNCTERKLAFLLILFLPIGLNIAFWLSGTTHSLMQYAYIFVLLLVYILIRYYRQQGGAVQLEIVFGLFMVLFLWKNVVSTNSLYLQKDLQDKARLSYMTRVLARLESEPGFAEKAEYIAVLGSSEGLSSAVDDYTMYQDGEQFFEFDTFRAYCKYVLNYNVDYCDYKTLINLQEIPEIKNLQSYPAEDCVIEMDNIYIIKVGKIAD